MRTQTWCRRSLGAGALVSGLVALLWGASCGDDETTATGTGGSAGSGASAGTGGTAGSGASAGTGGSAGSGASAGGGGAPVGPEVCDNGVDDDRDYRTDCDDSECFSEPHCEGTGIHVAKSGTDSSSCGSLADPCQSIGHGIDRATAGQAIYVHPGTYAESWISVASQTRLLSVDGPAATAINSGDASAVRFVGVSEAMVDGFEIYGSLDQGSPGDGLVRVLDADDITVRNCVLHDAPADQDVVKVSGEVSGLLLERLVAYNPAQRTGSNPCGSGAWYQENIDIFGSDAAPGDPPPVSNVIVRECWLFHTATGGDWLLYSKINAENILYENNVFGPSAGGGCGNPAVGIGTGEPGQPDPTAAVVTHAIVRNNVFVGLQGDAALAVMNADDSWVYNNTFWGNGGSGLRCVVEFRGNSHAVGRVELLNNVFANNHPADSGAVFFWVRDGLPDPFVHDYNLYHDNIAASDTPYTGEAHGVYAAPMLTSPAVPDLGTLSVERILELAESFRLQAGSPAQDQGVDAVARAGHPHWQPGETDRRWDIFRGARPAADSWDLGVHERQP